VVIVLAMPQTLLNRLYSRKRGGLFLLLIGATRFLRLTIVPVIRFSMLASGLFHFKFRVVDEATSPFFAESIAGTRCLAHYDCP